VLFPCEGDGTLRVRTVPKRQGWRMPEEEEEMDLQDADVERGALDGLNMNETSELLVPAKCIAMRDMCAGVSSICLAGSC